MRDPWATRVAGAVIGAFYLVTGAWAFLAPLSFFSKVATFPPRNIHLLPDAGAFQVGLGLALTVPVALRAPLRVPLVLRYGQLFLHVDDAASAAVAALEHGDGVYNIVDDDPASARYWIPAFCRDIRAPAPMHLPGWLVAFLAGRFAAATLQEGRGASNAKAKRELGWAPRHPTWRDGFVTRL